VIDVGRGRVALANDGRLVSVTPDGVVMKDARGRQPGEAETFQWVHLMRDDHMLMSLTNHRYLGSSSAPGAVTVTTTGPRPDRRSGAELRYRMSN
jgi:hypothetical protein